MKEKMMQGLLHGATIGQLNMVVESGATVNYYGSSRANTAITPTEEQVKRAVEKLMEEKDEGGKYLMCEQQQWYGVKAVLTKLCEFPVKPAQFERTLENLELAHLRVAYNGESVKKVHLHQLPANVELWHQYQNTADDYSMKQIKVAVRLIDLLKYE